MQVTIEIDDYLAKEFFAITPKDEQKSAIKTMFEHYLKTKKAPIIREGDDGVYGMWADRDIDVGEYMKEVRKGRQFNAH